jgi:crossover junction endodeoxyribonuclease RusA
MIELKLPYCPSVNHYKKMGGFSRTKDGKLFQKRVNSKETLQYYYEVWAIVKAQGLPSFHSATIYVEVDVYPPDARKRDIDGILKVLLDAMQNAKVYDDDYQIARLLVTRCEIISKGKLIVRIREINDVS